MQVPSYDVIFRLVYNSAGLFTLEKFFGRAELAKTNGPINQGYILYRGCGRMQTGCLLAARVQGL